MRKKLLSILLVLSLMLALVPAAFAAEPASGTCGAEGDGSNVIWTLDETGLLTISGTGKIASGTGGSIWSDKPVLAVDIRSGVTGVGKDAFYGCDDLQVISLPDTVTQLDDNAFGNCPALSDILVDAKNPAYKSVDGALYSKDGTVLVKGPANAETFVVPDGVATIGDYAFFGAKYLTSIYFPEGSLTTIGAMAFEFCEGLTELLLPAGVTEIGMYAFAHCSGLRSVDLPVSLKHVSDMAFLSAGTMDAGIADINYAGSEQQWNAIAFDDGVLGWMHKNFNTEQHTFGAWVTDGTRSCEQGVTMARSCGNDGCDLVQTVELPAYGHIWDSGTLLARRRHVEKMHEPRAADAALDTAGDRQLLFYWLQRAQERVHPGGHYKTQQPPVCRLHRAGEHLASRLADQHRLPVVPRNEQYQVRLLCRHGGAVEEHLHLGGYEYSQTVNSVRRCKDLLRAPGSCL